MSEIPSSLGTERSTTLPHSSGVPESSATSVVICDSDRCAYFIRRKQRRCTHRIAAGGDGLHCTEHTEQALESARRVAEMAQTEHACRKVLSDILDSVCGRSGEATEGGNDDNDPSGLLMLTRKRKKQHLRVSAPKRMANPFSTDLTPSLEGLRFDDFFGSNADAATADAVAITTAATAGAATARPVHIDVGCARGRCSELLAHSVERAGWNHLGLEIRPSIVRDALIRVFGEEYVNNEAVRDRFKSNLYFLTCNFAASAKEIMQLVPPGQVRLLSIQFPDPWVRRKKHLRRMLVQPALVQTLAEYMSPGSCVYISSDSERGMNWMLQCFAAAESSFSPLVREEVQSRCNKGDNMFVIDPKPRAGTTTSTGEVSAAAEVEAGDDAQFEGQSEEEEEEENNSGERSAGKKRSDNGASSSGTGAAASETDGDAAISWVSKYSQYMLDFNPLGVPSEREIVCEIKWIKVWRIVFERK